MSQDRWDQLLVTLFVATAVALLAGPVAWACGAGIGVLAVFALLAGVLNVATTVVLDLSKPARRRPSEARP